MTDKITPKFRKTNEGVIDRENEDNMGVIMCNETLQKRCMTENENEDKGSGEYWERQEGQACQINVMREMQ